MTMTEVVISGTGLYRPPCVISNEELVSAFNQYATLENEKHAADIAAGRRAPLPLSSVEFIEKASGIKQRYVMEKDGPLDPARMVPRYAARADEALSMQAEVAVAAVNQALAAAGRTGAQVDAVYCAAANMQRAYPAIAIEVQHAIGAGGYAYDMTVACSSATFAIEQAVNAIRCGKVRRVVVVNPEITAPNLEWRDRDCHFIFGDVSVATVLEAADAATAADQWQVLDTRLVTQFSNNIRCNFGFMAEAEDRQPGERALKFRQEGRKVFKEVVPLAAAHIENHLRQQGFEPTEVRRFWLHQANLGMNQLVIKKLRGPDVAAGDDVAPVILDEFANTASAGSIIAFHERRADLASGDLGVICSFGAGYSIGSVIVRKR